MAMMLDIVVLLLLHSYVVCCFAEDGYLCNDTKNTTGRSGVEIFFNKLVCEPAVIYFFAGFMTASMTLSVGCAMTKFRACKKINAISRDIERQQAKEPLVNHPEAEQPADDQPADDQPADDQPADNHPADPTDDLSTIDYDPTGYAYCLFDCAQGSNGIPASPKPHRGFNRQSYDLIDHNREKSTDLTNSDYASPYIHVTPDMEVTEYDNASHVRSRPEAMDPTYSHITKVKKANKEDNDTTKKRISNQKKEKVKLKKNEHKNRAKGKYKPKEETNSSSKHDVLKPIENLDGNGSSNNQDMTNIGDDSTEDFETPQTDQIIKREIFLNGLEYEKEAELGRTDLFDSSEADIKKSYASLDEMSKTTGIVNTLQGLTNDHKEVFTEVDGRVEGAISHKYQTKSFEIEDSDRNKNYFILSPDFCDSNENIFYGSSTVTPVAKDTIVGEYNTCDGLGTKDNDFLPSDKANHVKEVLTDGNIYPGLEPAINHEMGKDDTASTENNSGLDAINNSNSTLAINNLYEQVSFHDGKIFVGDFDISVVMKKQRCN